MGSLCVCEEFESFGVAVFARGIEVMKLFGEWASVAHGVEAWTTTEWASVRFLIWEVSIFRGILFILLITF